MAVEIFEKLGAADDAEDARNLLQQINVNLGACELDDDGELLTTVPLFVFIDSPFSDRAAKSKSWLRRLPRVLGMQLANASSLHSTSRQVR